jgi:release factor glutamine methyltransferase
MTLFELLRRGSAELRRAGIRNSAQEARWLLEHVLDGPVAAAWSAGSARPGTSQLRLFEQLLGRRVRREPLQYILGSTEFCGLTLAVGPGVLVPRPETECLALAGLRLYPGHGICCDLCTGSGAVALAMAQQLPDRVRIIASDASEAALQYAQRNLKRLCPGRIELLQSDLFNGLPAGMRCSLVTVNPPYVSETEFAALAREVRDYEPRSALVADADGMGVITRVLAEAPLRLQKNAWLLCEISSTHAVQALRTARACGYRRVDVMKDQFGRDRVLRAQWPGRHSNALDGDGNVD